MYLQQVKNGIEEYMSTDWTDEDATIDRAISRLDKKIMDKMWEADGGSWDFIRMIVELRRIRADNPKNASEINSDIHQFVNGLKPDSMRSSNCPRGFCSLRNNRSQAITSSLQYLRDHVRYLRETQGRGNY